MKKLPTATYGILLTAIFVNEDFSMSREVSCHDPSHLLGSTEQQAMPAGPPWGASQLRHQGAWTHKGVASAPAAASHKQNGFLNQVILSCQHVNQSLGCTISPETPLPSQPCSSAPQGQAVLRTLTAHCSMLGEHLQPANILTPIWAHVDKTGLTRSIWSCIISRCLCFYYQERQPPTCWKPQGRPQRPTAPGRRQPAEMPGLNRCVSTAHELPQRNPDISSDPQTGFLDTCKLLLSFTVEKSRMCYHQIPTAWTSRNTFLCKLCHLTPSSFHCVQQKYCRCNKYWHLYINKNIFFSPQIYL